jgi:hypothetical protein
MRPALDATPVGQWAVAGVASILQGRTVLRGSISVGGDMAKVKLPARANMVWRISEEKPLGEWVESGVPLASRPSRKDLPEVTSGSWVTSSYDLLNGTDVVEGDDTLPGELFDELFGAKPGKT